MSSGRSAHAKPDFRESRLLAVSPTCDSLDSVPGADHVSAMKTVLSSVQWSSAAFGDRCQSA
jgi:hypothetical protein